MRFLLIKNTAMHVKHIWSVLCHRSVGDSGSNNVSLFDVFEQISITLKPVGDNKLAKLPEEPKAFPHDYVLVSLWSREKNASLVGDLKAEVRVELNDPTGKKINEFDFPAVIPANTKRLRSNTGIGNLFVTTPGIYWFNVKVKNSDQKDYQLVAELPLEVLLTIE